MRQGRPISPFLFLTVVELLAIIVIQNPNLNGITIFDREINKSQLADDTTKYQIKSVKSVKLKLQLI